MAADGREFLYDTLGPGIGAAGRSVAQEAGGEEAFISLLDVVEDDGTHVPKLQPAGATPASAGARTPAAGGPDRGGDASTSGRELPWARASFRIRSPSLRLHNEIVAFCRFLEPTAEEAAMRQAAVDRVAALVASIFPSAKVKAFGSFATGLYLPTSDIDLVVLDSRSPDIVKALRAIGNRLVDAGMARNIQVIAKAKVPIIKFDDIESGLPFDISFDAANGPKTAAYVQRLMGSLPPMRPLAVILKLFLQQRELNEVYQGGIGSYALLVMVAAFLLQHPSRQPPRGNAASLETNLGILVLDFFHLFGRTHNYEEVALSCKGGGGYFKKAWRRGFLQYDRPHFLAVEDPQDESNDLGKGSYNIQRVQKAFDFAYQRLSSPIEPTESLLERIVRLDAVLMSRTSQALVPPPPPPLPPTDPASDAEAEAPSPGGGGDGGGGRKRARRRRGREERSPSRGRERGKDGKAAGKGRSPSPEGGRRASEERRRRRRPSSAGRSHHKKAKRERDF